MRGFTMPLAIDYGFLAISHYARIHRWKHVKHAPIEHARIEHARIEHAPVKHAADLPV